jgi:pimeloyl-ACP methyl ester carboxylesterase
MATIWINEIEIAYEDKGSGETTFLFVHGWACDRSFFAPQVKHFSRFARTVAVDLRGHGESNKPFGLYSIAAFAADLASLIQSLDLGSVIAVGHSMGGLVVLEMAANYPETVEAIVMVDPASFELSEERHVSAEQLIATIEAEDQQTRRDIIATRYFLPSSSKQLIHEITESMMATPSHVAAGALRGILDFDAKAAAKCCHVPALHIAATNPFNPPHRMSEWLAGVVNGWTVGAGHFCQLEAPDQVNAMIFAFLDHNIEAHRGA